jgi:hypothetical protein
MRIKCARIASQLSARWDDANPALPSATAAEHAARRAREVPTAEHVLVVWLLHLLPPSDEQAEVSALLASKGLSPGAVVVPVLSLIRRSEERGAARARSAAGGGDGSGES